MLTLVNLIPKWVWLAVVAALSATSCKLKWDNSGLSLEIEKGKTYVAQLEKSIAQAKTARAQQLAENEQRARVAEVAASNRQRALLDDARSARAELDGLRAALEVYTGPRLTASGTTKAANTIYTDPVPELLLQCADRYLEVARAADGHANDVKTLIDAWPK